MTGVSGYIGGCLTPRLIDGCFEVRALTPDSRKLDDHPWWSEVEVAEGDVLNPQSLETQ